MTTILNTLINNEEGFIVSAELVLIASIGILAMVVGLSEVAMNINNELEDVASAFGAMNQSYRANGSGGHQGEAGGGGFSDTSDFCDNANIRSGSSIDYEQ